MGRKQLGGILPVLGALLVFLLPASGPVYAQLPFDSGAAYAPNDPDTCLICHAADGPIPAENVMHGMHGIAGNPMSPFAEGQQGCQSCHGPSQAHLRGGAEGGRPLPAMVFDQRRPAQDQNAVCLSCHEQDAGHDWPGSAHEFAEVTCSSCHTVHDDEDQPLAAAGENAQCLDCHQRQEAQLLQASSHPLRSGQMACTDCHAPHGGPGPAALIEYNLNDQCYQCHAEKRGPFLWEHAPVAEDCTNCHTPHGSNHRNLLQARTPWMCQQCHLAQYHPSNAESGIGLPPQGASSNMLGRDCMNCHSQIHGSNHPSGSALTR